MAHLCPECEQVCTCSGDTGRIVRLEIPPEGCAHCRALEDDVSPVDGEDDDDWDDPEDEDIDSDEDEANAW
jgi:hypothetical protein